MSNADYNEVHCKVHKENKTIMFTMAGETSPFAEWKIPHYTDFSIPPLEMMEFNEVFRAGLEVDPDEGQFYASISETELDDHHMIMSFGNEHRAVRVVLTLNGEGREVVYKRFKRIFIRGAYEANRDLASSAKPEQILAIEKYLGIHRKPILTIVKS